MIVSIYNTEKDVRLNSKQSHTVTTSTVQAVQVEHALFDTTSFKHRSHKFENNVAHTSYTKQDSI